ncbi:hypothetical protein [Nocardioides dongxiaopingii]|uniref:hypothetical protein n=1 Tax=Nocardioides dongxiaopingii TaxID=2576036 RepID=UPI0010C76832|nr:hypothetical protein [Nocardioides dongxiaopingii]
MSWIERSVLTDPGLRGAVPDGEVPRAWSPAGQVSPGAERVTPHGVTREVDESHGLLDLVTGSWLPRWARGDRIDRLFGGVARWGLPGSRGAGLHVALADADGILVTDAHLVVLVGGSPTTVDDPARPGRQVSSRPYRSAWTCPRGAVVAARRRARLTGRGRVELYFDDRSMCAVMTGLVGTSGARRLLAALDVGPEPPR